MAAIETRPYLVSAKDAVTVSMRAVEPDADFDELPEKWEPGTRIRIRVRAELTAEFWESTRIPRDERVRLVALATCLAARAGWRSSAEFAASADRHVAETELMLDESVLAGVVSFQVMVTGDGRTSVGQESARLHRGARLWQLERPRSLVLQEAEGLFPTSAVSFAATSRPRVPWTVELSGGAEPESSVVSYLRLFVNTDLPGCAALIEGRAHSSVYVQMNVDVQLKVMSLLSSWADVQDADELARTAASDPGSIAGFGLEIAHRLRIDLAQAMRLVREEPLELVDRIRECEEYLATEAWE